MSGLQCFSKGLLRCPILERMSVSTPRTTEQVMGRLSLATILPCSNLW